MDKWYIKLIVEGNEEYAFFEIVKELGTANCFVLDVEDANGYGEMPDLFLDALRSELYDCVVCVYDVDNKADEEHSPYNHVRSGLLAIIGDDGTVDLVSVCNNPNILQLFLLAADKLENVSLKTGSKKANSSLVHKYWQEIASEKKDELGRLIKPSYDASSWQVDIMKFSILRGDYTYETLLENAKDLPQNYCKCIPSSNILPLLVALKEGDISYFEKIKKALDENND